jgi:hypothetical protein
MENYNVDDIFDKAMSDPKIQKQMKWQQRFVVPEGISKRELLLLRKGVRRQLHKIRNLMFNKAVDEKLFNEKLDDDDKMLKEYFEENHMNPNLALDWKTFTHSWDIHPKNPYKTVIFERWVAVGGGFDPETGAHQPPAFTKQGV